jgi:Pectate lyase superfamily protein
MKRSEFLRNLGLLPVGVAALAAQPSKTLAAPARAQRKTLGQVGRAQPASTTVTTTGATGNGVTNDGPAIQAAINGLPGGRGAIYLPSGNYNCATGLRYALNSRSFNGSLVLYGDGMDSTTLWLNGSNLTDGQFGIFNTGFTMVTVRDMTIRFTGNSATGTGLWLGQTTLPQFSNVGLRIDGTYASNATVLQLGNAPGPVGQTAVWQDVELTLSPGTAAYVTFVRVHADTFMWLGGGINTFFGSGVVDPRILYADAVYTEIFDSLSMFRGDTVSAQFCFVNMSEPQGQIVFDRCHLPKNFSTHFRNFTNFSPRVLLRNCSSEQWPIVCAGSPLPTMNYDSNVGWINRNAGTASIANGGSISHGLPATPTKWGLSSTVGGHIASVTSVTSAALTVGLMKYNGSNVTTAEQVAWWAEL